MPLASVHDLVMTLRSCRLLDGDQLTEVTQLAARIPDARLLAKELIKREWLTAYQANKLLQGRGKSLVLGQYVLLERLGEGGMGAVFKARHARMQRIVAIKIIRKDRLSNPSAVKRFHREIRAASGLDHPHIVHAIDADEVGGTHFFVMEYVEGTDLAKIVKQRGPLSAPLACDCIRQAALGLQHAFECGMVHRDVKPHNLLVATYSIHQTVTPGTVKILDMGLALAARVSGDDSNTAFTTEGTVMGSVDYIAPEQARDAHSVDIRADLYSLGCTFFYLLTARVPYPNGTAMEKLIRHQLDPTPSPRQFRHDVPEEVAAIVVKLMAKQPADRFQSPADLIAALKVVRFGSDSSEPSESFVPPDSPPVAEDTEETASVTFPVEPPQEPVAPPPAPVPSHRPSGRKRRPDGNRMKIIVAGSATAVVILILILGAWWTLSLPKKVATTRSEAASTRSKLPQPSTEQTRRDEADKALQPLLARASDPAAYLLGLAQDLRGFLANHSATPAATKACELLGQTLSRMPSPLQQLDPKKVPAGALKPWRLAGPQPNPELIAVLGDPEAPKMKLPSGLFGGLKRMVFTPDLRFLIAGDNEGTIRQWDLATGAEAKCYNKHGRPVATLALSPDGKNVVSTAIDDKHALLWELASGKDLFKFEGHLNRIARLAFSPDGQLVLSAGTDNSLRLWEVATGRERLGLVSPGLNIVRVGCFSPDGRFVVTGNREEKFLYQFSVEKGKETRRLEIEAGVSDMAMSPDGRMVLFGQQHLWGWPIQGAPQLLVSAQRREQILAQGCVTFNPDGSLFAVSSSQGRIEIYDTATNKLLNEWRGAGAEPDLAFAADGRHFAISNGTGTVWIFLLGPKPQP